MKVGNHEVLVGCDPELFLKKGRSYQCADGVIPGTKEHPHKVDKGAVQVDGMAVEFNIDPARSKEEFIDNVKSVMKTLEDMVGDHKLVAIPSVTFNPKVWGDAPDEAKVLGCEPDFNAYTQAANDKPDGPDRFRTAAGHIHIGWTEDQDINDPVFRRDCEALVKELDYRLGMVSLLVDPDTKRRQLYGKAGAYRPKSYGVEYRVLSNFWLKDEELMGWVYDTVINTVDNFLNNKQNIISNTWINNNNSGYEARKLINNGIIGNARDICQYIVGGNLEQVRGFNRLGGWWHEAV